MRQLPTPQIPRTITSNDFTWYQQIGVRKAVALTNWALGVQKALELQERGRTTDARTLLEATRTEFQAHVAATNDVALARELTLLDRLRTLL